MGAAFFRAVDFRPAGFRAGLFCAPVFRAVFRLEPFFAAPAREAVLRFGSFLRPTLAISCRSSSLIDWTMLFEAPLRLDFGRSPRLADRAAPAAICCCFDFAFAMQRERRPACSVPARRRLYFERIDCAKSIATKTTKPAMTSAR